MTVNQATEALAQARSEHERLLQEAQESPTQIAHVPAIGAGSFTEERITYDPAVLEASASAVLEAEKHLRAAHLARHDQLATEFSPKVAAVDGRIANLWDELRSAYQDRDELLRDFARQCRCRRNSSHWLGDAPPPLTYRQASSGGS